MSETACNQRGDQMAMNKNMNSFPTMTLAMSTAATQRLNCRISMLDPYARNAFFQSKIRLSEILCGQGFCTWREIQHRETGESLCKLYFRLGDQSFSWAVPKRKLHFDVSIKDPPTAYKGEPADETKVAMMTDQELMVAVVNLGNPLLSQPKPALAPVQDSEEQQLAWIKEFHDKNGKWPSSDDVYPPGNKIGRKVVVLRNSYKRGGLDWKIVNALNATGFPWDGKSNDWFSSFFLVYEFLKVHSLWPSCRNGATEDEMVLGGWLILQRRMYTRGILDPKKKWLLDRLNFDWGGYSRCQKRYPGSLIRLTLCAAPSSPAGPRNNPMRKPRRHSLYNQETNCFRQE